MIVNAMAAIVAGGLNMFGELTDSGEVWFELIAPESWVTDEAYRLPTKLRNAVGLTAPNGYDFILVGGTMENDEFNRDIFSFNCPAVLLCGWTKLEQKLLEPRDASRIMAFFLEDSYFSCQD